MAEKDKTNVAIAIVSFLIPIVGLVVYFAKKDDAPEAAKTYLGCAGAGFVLAFLGALAM